MAKASKTTTTVTTITLKLTIREAQVLRALCGAAGGDPEGPRAASDEVWDALRDSLDKSEAKVLPGPGLVLPETWDLFDGLPVMS